MLARWIATVAALLLACAQASASVRVERVGDLVHRVEHGLAIHRAAVVASHAELARNPKTARPARANPQDLASGQNAAPSHCHVWQKSLPGTNCASGNTIYAWDSAPFGDTAANENPTAGIPNFTFNLRFPGQQYDRETGTHYNYFRDYEPGSGRYVQSDPVGLWGGLSTFAYVHSRPITATDPSGLGRSGSGRGQTGCNVCGASTGRACSCRLTVLSAKPNEELLFAPDSRGSAPYGLDGEPIELHHVDQASDNVIEMTREEHRGGENFAANHSNTGQSESQIEERRWNRLRRRKFCEDFDAGRFEGLPTRPPSE